MSILRIQHIGAALSDYAEGAEALARAGLPVRDFRNDQGRGFQHDARILLGNECWLHVVHNWNPESRVNRFLRREGPGLEHVALESDDIEADVARLRDLGVPLLEDEIFDASDGFEAFVYPADAEGFTVELIQPHAKSWGYPGVARGRDVSDVLAVERLQQVVALAPDPSSAARRFARLFGLETTDDSIAFGNGCTLRFLGDRRAGLSHVALQSRAPESDASHLERSGFSRREDRWEVAGVAIRFVSSREAHAA